MCLPEELELEEDNRMLKAHKSVLNDELAQLNHMLSGPGTPRPQPRQLPRH